MPFKSKSQMKYLYSQDPKVAKDFEKKTTKKQIKNLPEKIETAASYKKRRKKK